MVVIARNIAAGLVNDDARLFAETVPDALTLAVFIRGAFYLIGRGRGTKGKVIWKDQSGGALLQVPAGFNDVWHHIFSRLC